MQDGPLNRASAKKRAVRGNPGAWQERDRGQPSGAHRRKVQAVRGNQQPQDDGGEDEYLGVSTGDDEFASRVQSRLSRRRFDDYMDRFAPVERQLADRALSEQPLQVGLEAADEAVSSQFDSSTRGAGGSTFRNLYRYGVSQTPNQQRQNETASSLAEVTSRVDARNDARQRERDRRLNLMAGGGLSSVKPDPGS